MAITVDVGGSPTDLVLTSAGHSILFTSGTCWEFDRCCSLDSVLVNCESIVPALEVFPTYMYKTSYTVDNTLFHNSTCQLMSQLPIVSSSQFSLQIPNQKHVSQQRTTLHPACHSRSFTDLVRDSASSLVCSLFLKKLSSVPQMSS